MASSSAPDRRFDRLKDEPASSQGQGFYRLLFGTIRNKIVLPFLILTLLVTMLGTFVVTRLVAASIQDRMTTQLLETSRAAGDRIVAWEQSQIDVLRLVVFTIGTPEAVEARDTQALSDILIALGANQGIPLMVGMDLNGTVFASSLLTPQGYQAGQLDGQNYTDYDFVQHVLNGDADEFGDKYAGIMTLDSTPILLTVAPVLNAQGQLVGAVAAGTPLGDVLAQTKLDTLADLTFYGAGGSAVETTFVLAPEMGVTALNLDPVLYDEAMAQSQETAPQRVIELNAREFQTAYVPLVIRRDMLGVIGVSWPRTLISAAITTNRNGLTVVFALVAMLVVVVGYSVAHSLTGPIRRLAQVAQLVAAGDLTQQSLVRTSDEIGVLGRVFDNMTLKLNEKTEALIEAYQEQEYRAAFFDAVIASTADGTVVLDAEGKIMHQNPAARDILSRNDLFWSQTLRDIVYEVPQAETRQVTHRYPLEDQWFEATASPVIAANDEEIGIVVTLRDITEQVLTDQMRSAFILQMSHELYTPLVAAKGFTELASKMTADQTLQNLLGRSLQGMNTLRDLLTQVVDVSRMIRGGFQVTPQDLHLDQLLQEVINEQRAEIEKKNLRLQVDVGALQLYTGGREPLRWAFKNLIKNAVDYTLPGGMIKVTAAEEETGIVVRIRDTGVGIPRHERARIFEQFYRGQPAAPDGTVIDIRGAGLGLFVVEQVVRAHGGEVEVWSEVGIGSEFTIHLPHEWDVSQVSQQPSGGVSLLDAH